jgi:molybdate transport system regulatory protein
LQRFGDGGDVANSATEAAPAGGTAALRGESLAHRMHCSERISKAFILFARGFDGNLACNGTEQIPMRKSGVRSLPHSRSLPHLSLRIDFDREERIGPGKIQLLEHIRDFGSISAAGRAMDMSYKRAWDLVEEINRICGHVAVARQTGGKNGGGAMLTPFGTSLVARYRKIERDAARAVRKELQALKTDIVRTRKA